MQYVHFKTYTHAKKILCSSVAILLQNLKSTYEMYAVEYNNCSTAMVHALQSGGFQIPETPRSHILLGNIEVNPADLGEDLRTNHPGGIFSSSNAYFTPPLSNCQ